MKILVINCGSSSLKYQLFDMDTNEMLAKGICEQIGGESTFTHKVPADETKNCKAVPMAMADHSAAIKIVIDTLTSEDRGVLTSMSEITAVGHRVLHGGEKFSGSVLVTDAVKDAIRECFDLGPLHNPANLMGIRGCMKVMPGVPMVAVFDTACGQSMDKKAFVYALPYEAYTEYKVRRYGFHGTSHRYVTARALELLGEEKKATAKVITFLFKNSLSKKTSKVITIVIIINNSIIPIPP
jgi:acetate kinase